jgi:uncharacterized membrane protein
MHRDLEVTVSPQSTDRLVEQLQQLEGVVSLSVHRGDSVKPPGDVISAAVLNDHADEVLGIIRSAEPDGTLSVSTSTLASLIDIDAHDQVRADNDEALWEEAETALRRHTRPNFNFLTTTAGGGLIATAGLAAASGVTEATALVAAAVIAPAFEPLARTSLGIVNRQGSVTRRGLATAALSFIVLLISSLLTMLVLRIGGHGYAHEFSHRSTVHEVQYPPLANLLLSAAGAVIGVTMISAGRFTQLAGPLVALQLLPAAVTVGAALELGDGAVAARGLGRLAIDWAMVLLAGLLVFSYKHVRTHRRRSVIR